MQIKAIHISGKWYLLPTISFTDKHLYGTYEISLEWLNFQIALIICVTESRKRINSFR